MKGYLLVLLLLGGLLPGARAQRVGWERTWVLPPPSEKETVIHQLDSPGRVTLCGCGQITPLGTSLQRFPALYARYDTAGTMRWLKQGRPLVSCEMDLQPWGKGYVYTANEVVGTQVGTGDNIGIFVQKLTADGDTLPAVRIPLARASGLPVQLLADRRGFTIAAYSTVDRIPGQNSSQELELIRTDTNGVVQ